MKKHAFLVPLTTLVAALLTPAAADAKLSTSTVIADDATVQKIPETTKQLPDALVIERPGPASGTTAYHYSHASHSSHSSHSSHYSSR